MENTKMSAPTDLEKQLNDIATAITSLMSCEIKDTIEGMNLDGEMDQEDAFWFCVMMAACQLTSRALAKTPKNSWEPYCEKFLEQMMSNASEIIRKQKVMDDIPEKEMHR